MIHTPKHNFFDRPAVIKAVGRQTARVFAQFGAWVTKTAKRSIRKAGKRKGSVSRPGEPPRSHNGLLKDHIYFAFEERTHSVVMGPAKISTKHAHSGKPVPATLEYGGSVEIPPRLVGIKTRSGVYLPPRAAHKETIKARPYMGPAVTKSTPKLSQFWAQSSRTRR